MITTKLLAAALAASFVSLPAMAQTSSKTEKSGHHYSGGPKTETIHHMGKKDTVGVATKRKSGGHHYTGGPKSEPHHMGDKK
ncbi:MAG: hypothetical protein HY852_14510 [Bradyrhizobium sp.]|uniref:hypothetical protein n=1 Tax=Bradyrhizobium sp. TaxID=376 RepID=UPI0025BB1FF0|nr:hypothetical protein [Bradyrhizobium sp.]MBI5263020.1 hypothetical protein [Bradyrhizobium sp.]